MEADYDILMSAAELLEQIPDQRENTENLPLSRIRAAQLRFIAKESK